MELKKDATNNNPSTLPPNIGIGITPDENFVTDDWDDDNDDDSTHNNEQCYLNSSNLNNTMIQPDENFLDDDWDE